MYNFCIPSIFWLLLCGLVCYDDKLTWQGRCDFSTKVKHAQDANAVAVIVIAKDQGKRRFVMVSRSNLTGIIAVLFIVRNVPLDVVSPDCPCGREHRHSVIHDAQK